MRLKRVVKSKVKQSHHRYNSWCAETSDCLDMSRASTRSAELRLFSVSEIYCRGFESLIRRHYVSRFLSTIHIAGFIQVVNVLYVRQYNLLTHSLTQKIRYVRASFYCFGSTSFFKIIVNIKAQFVDHQL